MTNGTVFTVYVLGSTLGNFIKGGGCAGTGNVIITSANVTVTLTRFDNRQLH